MNLGHYLERTRLNMRHNVLTHHTIMGELKENDALFLRWPGVNLSIAICQRAFGILRFRERLIPGTVALINTLVQLHIQQ